MKYLILSILLFVSYIEYGNANNIRTYTKTELLCQSSFIGYEYDESKRKTCHYLWNKWAKQIKKSFNN